MYAGWRPESRRSQQRLKSSPPCWGETVVVGWRRIPPLQEGTGRMVEVGSGLAQKAG